jgi:hypothetical protein
MPQGNYPSLHSRYNPQGEAERYINSLNLSPAVRYIILIEPGLCYLAPVLRKKNPDARVIALHAEKPAGPCPVENRPDSSWYPVSGLALRDFLAGEIPDTVAGEIRIIEWRPSLAVFGKAYLELLSETAGFVKQADANARTTKQFGRRWFSNFFRNLNLLSELIIPLPFETPVVIAGAGPSLEDTIPLILKEKKHSPLLVLAVSSAVPALRAGGVDPDLIITTDGGAWALLHLNECFRGSRGQLRCAAALTAALPSQCGSSAMLAISDGSLWQGLVLRELNIPFIALPQRGTVSASALDLALALTRGNIYFTGVDLSNRDIRTHARPYSFDRLWQERAGRFDPLYSQVYSRAWGINKGGSHGIYAAWFEKQIELYPKRIFSLGANSRVFSNLSARSFGEKKRPPGGDTRMPRFTTAALRFPEQAAKLGAAALRTALIGRQGRTTLSPQLIDELCSLVFPGGGPVSVEELMEALTRGAEGHA